MRRLQHGLRAASLSGVTATHAFDNFDLTIVSANSEFVIGTERIVFFFDQQEVLTYSTEAAELGHAYVRRQSRKMVENRTRGPIWRRTLACWRRDLASRILTTPGRCRFGMSGSEVVNQSRAHSVRRHMDLKSSTNSDYYSEIWPPRCEHSPMIY